MGVLWVSGYGATGVYLFTCKLFAMADPLVPLEGPLPPYLLIDRILDDLSEQAVSVIDQFLSPPELELVQKELFRFLESGGFQVAGIGKSETYRYDKAIRGDRIRWVGKEELRPEARFLFDRIDQLIAALNRWFYLGIRESEFHFAAYEPGTFYKRHLDSFQQSNSRKVSLILYLNDGWKPEDGGSLRIWEGEGKAAAFRDILPLGGRLVCFFSDRLEHEVLPARRLRLSFTGWLRTLSLPI